MKNLRRLVLLFFSFALSAALGLAEAQAIDSKLDPMLKMLKRQTMSVETAKTMNMIKEKPNREPMVKTVIKFTGNLEGIQSLGGEVGSIVGDVATVDIPLSSLEALSQMENIVYVEVSKKVKPRLDISVPSTKADELRSSSSPAWTGITGKGVIIGTIDTGLDLTHRDFRDSAGKTRILYLYDQTTDTECTNAMINNGTCSEQDTDGHGTHVAGVASGNGAASNYRYVGMAPEANLIVIKTTFYTQDIINGVSYIEQKASSLGKPCVINLSLGGDIDSHDGTSNFSRALDNASGPGKIITGAAGNEAEDGIHAGGYVSQGDQSSVAFDALPGMPVTIDIWYHGSDLMDIEVATPYCGNTRRVSPGNAQTFPTSCGIIAVSSEESNPNNGDKEILLTLSNPIAGTWSFSLYGNKVTNGRFDAWTDGSATFLNPDDSITLTDTGSTTNVISVGSYVTRPLDRTEPSAGNISAFSSHGPRRLCSICSLVQKPDITAPGQWIMSAFSKDTFYPDLSLLDPHGGPYIMMHGTSAATPHVTGAIALLLQDNPALTPEDIRNLLSSSAEKDSLTGNVPNDTWGYGKLDAYNAFSSLTPEIISAPTVTGPSNDFAGMSYIFSVGGASSNYGSKVQYFFDWGDGTNSGWLPPGTASAGHLWNLPGIYPVKAQARSALNSAAVSSWSPELLVDVNPSINLQAPSDNASFDACSLYNLPTFSWNAVEPFKGFEIQFSSDSNFSRIPVRVRVPSKFTEAVTNLSTWKKVLLMPGSTGGTVHWRVAGTRADGTKSTSDVASLVVEPPESVGSPNISNTTQSSLPALSWANNCDTKFKVWFGNDPDFTKRGIKKKSLTYNLKNPVDNGATFTKELTAGQWTSIRKLVGNGSGSFIYWYIESWDGPKRYTRTDTMNFTLID